MKSTQKKLGRDVSEKLLDIILGKHFRGILKGTLKTFEKNSRRNYWRTRTRSFKRNLGKFFGSIPGRTSVDV